MKLNLLYGDLDLKLVIFLIYLGARFILSIQFQAFVSAIFLTVLVKLPFIRMDVPIRTYFQFYSKANWNLKTGNTTQDENHVLGFRKSQWEGDCITLDDIRFLGLATSTRRENYVSTFAKRYYAVSKHGIKSSVTL